MARQYRSICAQAGRRLMEQRGWFWVADDGREPLALWRDSLLGMRCNLVSQHVATDDKIDALVREMDAAHGTAEFGTGSSIRGHDRRGAVSVCRRARFLGETGPHRGRGARERRAPTRARRGGACDVDDDIGTAAFSSSASRAALHAENQSQASARAQR